MRTQLKSGVVVDMARVRAVGWIKQDGLYRVYVTLYCGQDIMAGDFDTLDAANMYLTALRRRKGNEVV